MIMHSEYGKLIKFYRSNKEQITPNDPHQETPDQLLKSGTVSEAHPTLEQETPTDISKIARLSLRGIKFFKKSQTRQP